MSLVVIVGGQYGSEAKGAATAGAIERDQDRRVWNVRVAGPNAGHTAYDKTGRAWPLRTVPVGAVVDHPHVTCVIAAGSEIDPEVLLSELTELDAAGIQAELWIDGQATVLTEEHKAIESGAKLVGRIGSTGKGIGAARAARLMRTAVTYDDWWRSQPADIRGAFPPPMDDTAFYLQAAALDPRQLVVIEGTQGYALGLHAGHYPQCTSSDCRAVDFCAMAGISPWAVSDLTILICMRVHPIRVAGNSGPLEFETTWEALGLPVELTTVTKKPRRVGTWDADLAERAVRANPGGVIYLSMLDQLPGAVAEDKEGPYITDVGMAFIKQVEQDTGTEVAFVGTGPKTADQIAL